MTLIRILCAIGGLVLLAAIIWASLTAGQSLAEAVAWLISEPWGVVSLVDLYLSFFFVAVLIWCLETKKAIALLFILPLPFLGHVWSAVWMVWRLAALLRARNAAA